MRELTAVMSNPPSEAKKRVGTLVQDGAPPEKRTEPEAKSESESVKN